MSPAAAAVLLDTSTVIELSAQPHRVAEPIRGFLAQPSTRLFVSAATAWEVAIKTARGRLPRGAALIDAWEHNLREMRAEPLDISHLDALAAGSLEWAHRDPFDRMLVAQAIRYGCRLATRNREILAADVVPTIDTRA